MNNAMTIDTQFAYPRGGFASSTNQSRYQIPTWQRLLIASAIFVVLSVISGGVWMFGMLIFTFALDGASNSQLPNWLEPFMLVLWPISIAMIPMLPATLTVSSANWKWVLGIGFTTVGLAATVYAVGVITLFSSL